MKIKIFDNDEVEIDASAEPALKMRIVSSTDALVIVGYDAHEAARSCYDRLEYAIEAERQGADYVAFGAFFASVTKPGAVSAPIDLLCDAQRKLRIPIVAIGGITPENALELIGQGADVVAVSNALFNDGNIQSAARSFSRLFKLGQFSISHHHGLANNVT